MVQNSENMVLNDSDMRHQAKQRLLFVISQLDSLRNAEIMINRIPSELLYEIFRLAVYDSLCPEETALKVSGVCRHWRKSALGWPALWAFVNSESPRWIVDLFMSRSGDAPLTVSWSQIEVQEPDTLPSQSYLETRIFPRLSSLDLYITYDELVQVQRLSRDYQIPPLRLRCLNVQTDNYSPQNEPVSIEFIPMDVSCLQQLELEGINLPHFDLLHDKLTNVVLTYWDHRPALSRLLVFLSNCPVLRDLQLNVVDRPGMNSTATTMTTPTNFITANLPKLKSLAFTATGVVSYNYFRTCFEFIRFSERPSQFKLNLKHGIMGDDLVPCTIFKPVPFEIWSHFTNCAYLMLDLDDVFAIASAPNNYHNGREPFAFYLSGPTKSFSTLNRSDILEFIHTMSKITHLELSPGTLHRFKWFQIDIQKEFPCLDILTLGLVGRDYYATEILNRLPRDLKVKELQLRNMNMNRTSNPDLDAILKFDIKRLVLFHWSHNVPESHVEVINTLLKRGIQVFKDDTCLEVRDG